jgi:hypothetical protein
MVKNEGEPEEVLIVTTQNNVVTLQIVELNDDNQVKLMARATHFNPVDLVCGIKITKTKSST